MGITMPANLVEVERKWQREWERAKLFEVDPISLKPKFFITVAYPYPNLPQHIGHGRTYALTDIHARYMRMRGYQTLFPMAFHYTGTPVLAMSKRLEAGDEDIIDTFTRICKVPLDVLEGFKEPLKIAQYFHEEIKMGMKEMGYSIDWRREFTTIDPCYNRFIEWQFHKLRERGYITKGSHPVGWCPSCGNPVGQHDTRGDMEPEVEEFTVIFFESPEAILPTATLRPETVFGVTNIWLNPEVEYVEADVDGQRWIISRECIEKLRLQNKVVNVRSFIRGRTLLGKQVRNPVTNRYVPILPAEFVDPRNATGVVMSVPAHAPYDYVGLESLVKEPSRLKEYGLSQGLLEEVKPISVIKIPEGSEFLTVEAVQRLGIESQRDRRLEDVTKDVYNMEFSRGLMRENTGKYVGLSVTEAKEAVKKDLIQAGRASVMYELINRPIFCRCGAECVVKIFEDQWFIDYGNPEWKRLVHEWLKEMEVLPKELIQEFENVVDWLRAKACARKSGLGTRLPWDQEWIIESLSDSTIYMAYYILSKHVNQLRLQASQLTDAFFDYVLLGFGEPDQLSDTTGLSSNTLKQIREEFLYFYPVDSRHSGRDLVSNHLTFFIFNHLAIFPRAQWPRQIVVNGSVLMEGQKMSKSLGNIIPLREAIKNYAADPLRVAVVSTAGLLQDADFSPGLAKAVGEWLERFRNHALDLCVKSKGIEEFNLTRNIDRWMVSRLNTYVNEVTEAMDELDVRRAIQVIMYELDRDIQWYTRRTSSEVDLPMRMEATTNVLRQVLDARVRMLAPFTPHLCEELWHTMGGEGFIAETSWPVSNPSKIDLKAEEVENLAKTLLEDTFNILRATGIAPKQICYYFSAPWKWKVFLKTLQAVDAGIVTVGGLMKMLMEDPELRAKGRLTAGFAEGVFKELSHASKETLKRWLAVGVLDEVEALREMLVFFQQELKADVHVFSEEDTERYDPRDRARLAKPLRPGVYVE